MDIFQPISLELYEVIIAKVLFSFIIYKYSLPKKVNYHIQSYPISLSKYFNLDFLSNKKIYKKLRLVGILFLSFYVVGLLEFIVLPYLLVLTTLIGSYRNSQGAINHQRQIISIILLVQSVFCIYYLIQNKDTLNLFIDFSNLEYSRNSFFLTQQAILAVYFTSAVTKLHHSKFKWIQQVDYAQLQFIKTSQQEYYSSGDSSKVSRAEKVSSFLLSHKSFTKIIFSLGLILELISPLFLINRLTNIIGAVLYFGFHKANSTMMRLHFNELQFVALIYFLHAPYLVHSLIKTF